MVAPRNTTNFHPALFSFRITELLSIYVDYTHLSPHSRHGFRPDALATAWWENDRPIIELGRDDCNSYYSNRDR